jgi:peptidoglycan-associated lipoprotein
MQKGIVIGIALIGALLAGGCSTPKPKPASATPAASAVPVQSANSAGADAASAAGASVANGTAPGVAGPAGEQLQQRTIYFDFDSSEIKPEGEPVVAAFARYLTANPTAKVRLEGNTDERGTREYNIALGERRAQSVAHALQAAGVSPSQLSLTSYGEERPVALGHDEASYSQNRRVELIQQ